MDFVWPAALWGFLPWLALGAWLLRGRRAKVRVAFLTLWRQATPPLPGRRRLRSPPWPVLLLWLAAGAALLALAQPRVPAGQAVANHWTVVLSRDPWLAARRQGKQLEYTLLLRQADQWLGPQVGRITLMPAPQKVIQCSRSQWLEQADNWTPVATGAAEATRRAVLQALAESDRPVLLVGNRAIDLRDPRLFVLAQARLLENVGIDYFAAVASPLGQAMVRLLNHSDRKNALLTLSDGQTPTSLTVDLPPRGQSRDYFVDLPRLGPWLEAHITPDDDFAADNRAWISRRGRSAVAVAAGALSPPLQKMVAVWNRLRADPASGLRVMVASDLADHPAEEPMVLMPPATQPLQAPLRIAAHPITEHIDWQNVERDGWAAPSPPSGFSPLVSDAAGRTLLAIRSEPARQVWIGLQSAELFNSSDWVLLFSQAMQWIGGPSARWLSEDAAAISGAWKTVSAAPPEGSAQQGWWPGLYENGQGQWLAVGRRWDDAPPSIDLVPAAPPMRQHWRELTVPLLWLALAAGGLAAWGFIRKSPSLTARASV